MIIVSQDKTEIVNFDNIGKVYIDYSNGNYKVICTDAEGCFLTRLGVFETEERAKEVLQEIINKYKEVKPIFNENMTRYIYECNIPKVYEMPEE